MKDAHGQNGTRNSELQTSYKEQDTSLFEHLPITYKAKSHKSAFKSYSGSTPETILERMRPPSTQYTAPLHSRLKPIFKN